MESNKNTLCNTEVPLKEFLSTLDEEDKKSFKRMMNDTATALDVYAEEVLEEEEFREEEEDEFEY